MDQLVRRPKRRSNDAPADIGSRLTLLALVALSESPIHDDASKFVSISSIARDISERRREEEQAQTTRDLIEASLDPMVIISPEGV